MLTPRRRPPSWIALRRPHLAGHERLPWLPHSLLLRVPGDGGGEQGRTRRALPLQVRWVMEQLLQQWQHPRKPGDGTVPARPALRLPALSGLPQRATLRTLRWRLRRVPRPRRAWAIGFTIKVEREGARLKHKNRVIYHPLSSDSDHSLPTDSGSKGGKSEISGTLLEWARCRWGS
jgi:hypothetical protein